jgi:hypothetical protein
MACLLIHLLVSHSTTRHIRKRWLSNLCYPAFCLSCIKQTIVKMTPGTSVFMICLNTSFDNIADVEHSSYFHRSRRFIPSFDWYVVLIHCHLYLSTYIDSSRSRLPGLIVHLNTTHRYPFVLVLRRETSPAATTPGSYKALVCSWKDL